MNKQITSVNSVNLVVAVVLGLAVVVGVVAGIASPVAAPQPAPVIGSAQAVTNYFRNVAIKPSDNSVALSMTLYTTPTVNALTLESSSGSDLFMIGPSGNVSVTGALNVTGSVYAANDLAAKYITSTNAISMAGATFSGTLHYGVATAYVSGTAISTGFVSTATACVASPATQQLTHTVNISSSTAFSMETSLDGGTLFWFCGQ